MKRLLYLAALPMLLAATCPGEDDPTNPNLIDIAGSWTLQSLNNDPLPAPWNDNGITRTVTAGSVSINANGTFSYTETVTGQPLDQTTGTWTATATANTYSFIPNAQSGEATNNGTGVFTQNTMTLTIAGSSDVRVYSRN